MCCIRFFEHTRAQTHAHAGSSPAHTYIIVLLGALMDGIYSFGVYSTSFFQIADPSTIGQHNFEKTSAIHRLADPTLYLYLAGALGSIITYLAEISLFNYLFTKVFRKNLFLCLRINH